MLITCNQIPTEFTGFRHLLPIAENGLIGFLDIETTGLNHRRDPIMLIGLMILGPKDGMLHQYFAQTLQEENEILDALIHLISPEIPLFTYNGRSFDIPYINRRLEHHGLLCRIPTGCCVDLLHWAKAAVPESPRHNLKTIEKHLGIHRKDTLSGADCVIQYREYLDTRDPQLAASICQHNYEDILHMAPLLQLYDMLPADSSLRILPLNLDLSSDLFWIERITFKNGFLSICGSCSRKSGKRIANYTGGASFQLSNGSFEATLPVMPFPYPEPGSLYLDPDQIPGYISVLFNQLPVHNKLALLLRSGNRYIPENLESCIRRLMEPE